MTNTEFRNNLERFAELIPAWDTAATTSKQNVKDKGEIFTPEFIVKEMMDLLPLDFLEDSESLIMEPTCGTGNFLVYMYVYKRAAGLTPEESLNTILGMECNRDTLKTSKQRLFSMFSEDIKDESVDNLNMLKRAIVIIENNIFHVEDSLVVMEDYSKGTGILRDKLFVFNDPTGNDKVMDITASNRLCELASKVVESWI